VQDVSSSILPVSLYGNPSNDDVILPLHTDVSVRACTSCRPFVITSKEKGVVAESLDTVSEHRFVQKISVLSE